MKTTSRLLLEAGVLAQIQKTIRDHESSSVADASRADKKALSEIKALLKMLEEEEN